MNNHIIVGPRDICLCGMYGSRSLVCQDILDAIGALRPYRDGASRQETASMELFRLLTAKSVDLDLPRNLQQQCLPPDGIHDDPPDTRPRCPICNCPAYKSLDGILKCPSNTCGWGKPNDGGMMHKICPQCERANTFKANECQWCGWVPGKLESTIEISADSNVESVRAKLLARSKVGLEKYGVTTERQDVTMAGWLKHQQEELMDAAVYAEAAIQKLEEVEHCARILCGLIESLPAGEGQTSASMAASELSRKIANL